MTPRIKTVGKQNRFESVWDAIEDTPAQAENMKLRSALMLALKDHIAEEDLSQSKAAKLFGVTQPRISDLMRGRIDLFAIDTLVNMLTTAGLRVELHIAKAA
jgi:predicted XRE-type DNA-binding protein